MTMKEHPDKDVRNVMDACLAIAEADTHTDEQKHGRATYYALETLAMFLADPKNKVGIDAAVEDLRRSFSLYTDREPDNETVRLYQTAVLLCDGNLTHALCRLLVAACGVAMSAGHSADVFGQVASKMWDYTMKLKKDDVDVREASVLINSRDKGEA